MKDQSIDWQVAYRRAEEIVGDIREELAEYVYTIIHGDNASTSGIVAAIAERLMEYGDEDGE